VCVNHLLAYSHRFLDIQSLKNCSDIAYEPDCRFKAALGHCNTILTNYLQVKDYCANTCGLCNTRLECGKLIINCNFGTCVSFNYFGISSIRCNCAENLAGTYCHRANACNSSPCSNGGTCISLNDEDQFYMCKCAEGCWGKNCENCYRTIGCSTTTCHNGGLCLIDSSNRTYCSCLNGFFGQQCEFC
jgi:hypothetical protein